MMEDNNREVSGKCRLHGRRSRKSAFAAGFFVFSLSLFCLTGCEKGVVAENEDQKGYSLPEIMIVAMAEKSRYESVCTSEIWDVSISGEGMDFSDYLTNQIRDFMENIKIMNALAAENNVTLTSAERAEMSAAAEEYYKSLSKQDISRMGVTKENVLKVYEEYRLASKLVEELTRGINLEVSDSEAKVITILQAETGSRENAESLLQAVSQENADFKKIAEDAGAAVSEKQLGREEESRGFEDAAFGLASGQLSGIIADGDSFYILKCISDYDEEATKARKDLIFEERRKNAFEEIYKEYKDSFDTEFPDEPWKELDLAGSDYAENADFFGIYKKYAE